MNELLDNVNKKLREKPLIYFTREAERALGLENLLKNYHICCVQDNDIVDQLIKRGCSVFCAEREQVQLRTSSTNALIDDAHVQAWIEKISDQKGFYAMTFYPSQVIHFKIKKLGGTLLNNSYELNRMFEDKVSAFNLMKDAGVSLPRTFLETAENLDYENVTAEFGDIFVIQSARGHTGSGTFIIDSPEKFNKVIEILAGNVVKISEFLQGDTYTVNACITDDATFINGLQFQITGIPELTPSKGSTVGNDFVQSKDMPSQVKHSILVITDKIAKSMKEKGYRGLFGIDLILTDMHVYLIEINARQTANIPLQTKLELQQLQQPPLLLFHIAQFLGLETANHESEYKYLAELHGSQLFLRAPEDNYKIHHVVRSGIYTMPNKGGMRLEDLYIRDGYSIDDLENGEMVLLVQKSGSEKNKFDEIARIQLNHGIIETGKVSDNLISVLSHLKI